MGNDLRKPICQIEVDEDDSLNADRSEDANDGKENGGEDSDSV